jgi:ankyrin repeat protein
MKIKILLAVILLVSALQLPAATNDLTARLQQGLFDEEANRDLNAAIADYQGLAAQFDQDRQVAATAIYRLGECYRKLGQTNDAVVQYQRIIREFADQKDLVTLSRQNLTGLGVDFQPTVGQLPQTISSVAPSEAKVNSNSTAAEKVQLLANQLAGLDQLTNDPEKLAYTVLALYPDNDLNNMLVRLPLLKEQEAQARENTNATFTVSALPFDATSMSVDQFLNNQSGKGFTSLREEGPSLAHEQIVKQLSFIGLRVDFIISLQKARLQALQADTGTTASNPGNGVAAAPTTDEETQEIVRIQQMIQNSPDLINAPGENRLTPLARAANNGWLKVAGYLLDHGAEANAGANSIASPLYEAAGAGNRAMVELLLSRGAEVNSPSPQGSGGVPTPLAVAVSRGFPAVVEVLLAAKADVNVPNSDGNTPLHEALLHGQDKIARMLLAAGANPNAKNHDGDTPLMAVPQHANANTLKLLLEAGAGPNLTNIQGRTTLSYAAEFGSVSELQLLLAARADPNGGNLDAPLMFAINRSDLVAAECLLKAGANPNFNGAVDGELQKPSPGGGILANYHHSSTPLFFAIWTDQLAMVQLLLKYQADPNDAQTDGRSLLFSALDKPEILIALLDAGAQVDARDLTSSAYIINGVSSKPNWTPLIQALLENRPPEVVEILLNHGANANLPDETFGRPPLLWTMGWGNDRVPDRAVVDLLLAHQTDPNLRDINGRTLLDYLKIAGHNATTQKQTALSSIAGLLRQDGALDHLPDWNHIAASRPDAGFSRVYFTRETNDWNQFTLLDLVAVQFRFLARSPNSQEVDSDKAVFFGPGSQSLPFPDLSRLRIHRPAADQKSSREIPVDLVSALETGDDSNDVPLAWGDMVEIPETDHSLNEAWPGFSDQELANLRKCLTRHVSIVVKGHTNVVTLAPKMEFPGETLPVRLGSGTVFNTEISSEVPYWLGPVLLKSELVLTSSDLAHVQVTRQDPKSGKIREWMVDCTGISQNHFNDPDLWLRDGDVITVPERP